MYVKWVNVQGVKWVYMQAGCTVCVGAGYEVDEHGVPGCDLVHGWPRIGN